MILITPLANPRAALWVSARANGSFTISASAPIPAGVTIQYLVIS
jgi:hypothetical protein